ncbi:DUF4907 domain-containing protein [Maribacter polysaccharolyticus]|uniref:DUF4907 domain-containing protein n=1 Tax=Maribacter polysaccharolyticus TaxID=3020831 RepID=UPI00237F05A4|nr:DUF4907 domain-containing protein [Maribacter polysaccharolyticus]MDE3741142.1 DUF4907 domain-containing protein [Maribacter polysaccharolyticus]
MKRIITYILVFFTITIVVTYFSMLLYRQVEMNKSDSSLELIVKETEHGWGYEILEDNKIIVIQEIIPGVIGNQYFKTKKDAKKIGLLVLTKLKNNKRPIITAEDLEENRIEYKN